MKSGRAASVQDAALPQIVVARTGPAEIPAPDELHSDVAARHERNGDPNPARQQGDEEEQQEP